MCACMCVRVCVCVCVLGCLGDYVFFVCVCVCVSAYGKNTRFFGMMLLAQH